MGAANDLVTMFATQTSLAQVGYHEDLISQARPTQKAGYLLKVAEVVQKNRLRRAEKTKNQLARYQQ